MRNAPKLVITIFAAAAGLLLLNMLVTYRVGVVAAQGQHKMSGQRLVLKRLEDVASTMKDAEDGERGFLLTGEGGYLEPYQNALSRISGQLDALRELGTNGDLPTNEVDELTALVHRKLATLAQLIEIRRAEGLEPALAILRSDNGEELMNRIRATVERMEDSEHAEFVEASRSADRAAEVRNLTFIGAGLLNALFFAWAFVKISREMQRREAAVREASEQRELLATTLASIGDGVIVTDPAGCVTFLNGEAEQLTGWDNAAAGGRALPEIFHVVSDSGEQPLENPLELVERSGTFVDLADHSVLIARDGRRTPIADSAAPIRRPGNTLAGLVLVFRDVTEQRRARDVLARSNQQLERLVEARTAKLREMVDELQHVSYAITHDMRAPLRAMSAFAGLLLEQASAANGTDETRDYSRRILAASERLDKLIQDSLHYTKAVLQEMPLEPVDLSPLVRSLVETYPNLQADKADIHITGELPVVLGNESLLTQCFSNLLGNAVKFVAPGVRPDVCVDSETSGDTATIRVRDNGIGIPAHAQPRLFGMFQRLTSDYEGSGIGLAIVRKVVERMGGKVGAESWPGRGSCFWLELPLAHVVKR